jgi:hypothetical protein
MTENMAAKRGEQSVIMSSETISSLSLSQWFVYCLRNQQSHILGIFCLHLSRWNFSQCNINYPYKYPFNLNYLSSKYKVVKLAKNLYFRKFRHKCNRHVSLR